MSHDDHEFSHVIPIPGGDVLVPRKELANKKLRVSDRTAARAKYPTIYIGNTAYVALNASLKIVADGVSKPQRQRGRRAR